MALPAGISTATVTVGVPVTFSGGAVRSTVSIMPSAFLVHTATGHPLVNMIEEQITGDGVAAQFTLPHTDQDGFQDESGNAYKNWYYTATIQYSTDKGTRPAFTKVFQLAVGQTTVDLDLLPSGNAALPWTAPVAGVTSVNGETGAVTLSLDSESVGLGLVDNTPDSEKPVSNPQALALSLKLEPDTKLFPTLAKARNAAAVRSNWWLCGDSKEESYGASNQANRAFTQVQEKFRAHYPSGAVGGAFRPPRYNTSPLAWTDVFTFSGAGNNVGLGFAHRGRQLSHDATPANTGKATLTGVTATEIEVFFWRLSADQATITVDGVLLGTHTLPVSGSKASVWSSGALPKVNGTDVHTIVIQQTGGSNSAPVLAGINLINGDKTKGLHFIDNTISGGKTSGFVEQAGDSASTKANKESWAEFIPLLAPELFVFEFLTNDVVTDTSVLYEENVRKFITLARAKSGKATPFLLMPPEEPSDRVLIEPWQNYLAALKRIAKDTANVRFYDVSQRIPKQGDGNPNGIYMDAVHYAPHFQGAWADHHVKAVLGPDPFDAELPLIVSPNGTRFRVSVDDDGALTTTSL